MNDEKTASGAVQLLALLLTDIEASTRAWQHHGQSMAGVLDGVDECVSTQTARFGGEVIKARGEGDSHFVVFDLPTSAVCAAAAIQRTLATTVWPDPTSALHLRAAIHVGEVERCGDDLRGPAINYAARLRSTAHGDQIVVSRAVVELAAAQPPDLSFESLGRHRVRDLPGWTEVFQLCGPGLRHEFPPLATIDTGLPPITAIVMLDVVDHTTTVERLPASEEPAAWARITQAFTEAFTNSDGQYLKILGDGCLALFADPDLARLFTRTARDDLAATAITLRSVITSADWRLPTTNPPGDRSAKPPKPYATRNLAASS